MTISIAYSPYYLVPRCFLNSRSKGKRRGALFKVNFGNGYLGYADCHPWPELGDRSLEELLCELREGRIPPQLASSLAFAKWDAFFPTKRSWKGPPSHLLLSVAHLPSPEKLLEWKARGITYLKVKIGWKPMEEAETLCKVIHTSEGKAMHWRLDANGSLTPKLFEQFLRTLGKRCLSAIDFIEDPTPFSREQWREWQKQHGVALAADRDSLRAHRYPESASVLILKPAIQPLEELLALMKGPQRCIVTSYLDHPIGQVTAATTAALLYSYYPRKREVCGLLSHLLYESNSFSHRFRLSGNSLKISEGKGWGFRTLLEQRHWQELKLPQIQVK